MKKKLLFITGNSGKLAEAQAILPGVVGKDIDLPEIQEVDARKVVAAKLNAAYALQGGEYIVEDTSVYIHAMNGLPGPLIKWFLKSLGDDGLARLAQSYSDTSAKAVTMIGYINAEGEKHFFEGVIEGEIVPPRGEAGFGWDKIFMPTGLQKTFGEMSREEKNSLSMRKKAFDQLALHLHTHVKN